METLQTLLFVLQVIVAVALIGFVLIQHGKGADTGAAFGSGASSTVFGSRGSGNFLTRTTTVLAAIFLANSLFLGYLSSNMAKGKGSLLDTETAPMTQPQTGPGSMEGTTAPSTGKTTTATAPRDKPADMPKGDTGSTSPDIPVLPAPAEKSSTSDVPKVPEK